MNKTIKAAALAYNMGQDYAPKVIASGVGEVAKRIIQKAKECDIALFSNPMLVDSLLKVELDCTIPEELYESVVQVFLWLNSVENNAQMSK
ncbi:flagellar biosynthesis protein FlhB [Helicobacter pylori]|uniref:FlhB-like flagellar biosynthesis protein n=1 Tax=Helicobacter pylori TaxID=210 RepID=UPI001AA422B3|nr:FlhB-like flagellar biosynthesis protein [Helicobacter pylori]GHS30510.1 flagellar biosynthesis protein FlhB [Helicobacter pylori]